MKFKLLCEQSLNGYIYAFIESKGKKLRVFVLLFDECISLNILHSVMNIAPIGANRFFCYGNVPMMWDLSKSLAITFSLALNISDFLS
eukprot:snap_masked-scaffold_41-processed-gene-1.10-mRNA-1 protein AED:1.00 eAED:1.00 QI:0/0/0/0/1/1/2/0/87